MKPQNAYILRCLRNAGERGVTSNFFRQHGERYIADPPKRISELREAGFTISSEPVRTRSGSTCRLYRLEGEPPADLDAGLDQGDGTQDPAGQSARVHLAGGAPSDPPGSSPDATPAPVGSLFPESVGRVKPQHDREAA